MTVSRWAGFLFVGVLMLLDAGVARGGSGASGACTASVSCQKASAACTGSGSFYYPSTGISQESMCEEAGKFRACTYKEVRIDTTGKRTVSQEHSTYICCVAGGGALSTPSEESAKLLCVGVN